MYRAILDYLKKHRHLRSLKLLIFSAVLLLGLALSLILSMLAGKIYAKNAYDLKTREISDSLEVLAGNMVLYGYMPTGESDVINLEISRLTSVYDGRLLVVNSGYKIIKDTSGALTDKYALLPDILEAFENGKKAELDSESKTLDLLIPIYDGQTLTGTGKTVGIIKAVVSLKSIETESRALVRKLLLIDLLILLFISGFAFLISYLLSRPIVRLSKTVERVASFEEGDINMMGYQETEGIIRAFNAQRKRLKTLDDSRQEFVSDVSHELKTPIASMKVLADSLLLEENVPIEMYRDFMQDIADEVDRENKIITDLLELVHMDRGKDGLNISQVDCIAMLELIIKRLTPIAAQNEVEIIFNPHRTVIAQADEVKLTLAITNLVENAIKYNRKNGWVNIDLDANHQFMFLEISDSGIGIPEDSVSHIYERFYRADKSHSKAIGGTGLGLPITRKIVLLHRGSINVNSVQGQGTVFSVRIPLTYVI